MVMKMIIEKLQRKDNFSATEEAIADYFLNQADQITMTSISQIADATYSSNATIIRLCRKLGCTGFKDFKMKYLRELSHAHNAMDMNRPFYLGEGTAKITQSLAELYTQCVLDCRHSIDNETIEDAAKALLNARRIFIYGVGDSQIRAQGFMNRLIKLNIFCINASQLGEDVSISLNSGPQDIGLFVSYRAQNEMLTESARLLKNNHCPIIVISSDTKTKLTQLATWHITFPKKEKDDNVATFYSQIGFDFILNTLYSLIYAHRYEQHHRTKQIIDDYQAK